MLTEEVTVIGKWEGMGEKRNCTVGFFKRIIILLSFLRVIAHSNRGSTFKGKNLLLEEQFFPNKKFNTSEKKAKA